MSFITTELRPQGLPVSMDVPNGPRLAAIFARNTEDENAIRDLKKQETPLVNEGQKLVAGKSYSVESSARLAEITRELEIIRRRLAEREFCLARGRDELEQWRVQIATKLYQRSSLWRELGEAVEGEASEISDAPIIRTHNIGEREKKTKGDVRRDLISVLRWLLAFAGEDAGMRKEPNQLQLGG